MKPHVTIYFGSNFELLLVDYKMQLTTAQKFVKRARLAKNRITRSLFNVESPNFIRMSMQIYSTATADMTSLVTSVRHFLLEVQEKKMVENAASHGFLSIFSGTTFCLHHQLVGFVLGKTPNDVLPYAMTRPPSFWSRARP